MTNAEKVRENRLRRALDRQGYRLMKSRARDPRDRTYGGYHIVDHEVGVLIAGGGNSGRDYTFDLDEVEEWANRPVARGPGVRNGSA